MEEFLEMEPSKLAVLVAASISFVVSCISIFTSYDAFKALGSDGKYKVLCFSFSLIIGAVSVSF